jgi:RNA polymerase sigma-70 factor (ECF subfamily)
VQTSAVAHQEEPEAELITRCRAGEVDAFRRLVMRFEHYAYALAFRMVCSEDRAREIVQESFIRVWKSFDRFDPSKKFTTWLYAIVVNLAYDGIRADRRRLGLFSGSPGEGDRSASGEELAETVANRDLAEKIRELTGFLPPKQRMVFVLRDLQDLSVEEVAGTLGMSASSVKANLCYARQQIRKRLERLMKE